MNSKVLVVGMADSIHLARWLELFEGSNTDFILVPSGPNVLVHPRIEALIRGEKPGISCQIEPRFLSWAGRVDCLVD
jgi:hypothetical protein